MASPLLQVEDLRVELSTRNGMVSVVDGLSFSLEEGANISFVGESGCGKSITALAIMGLLPQPAGRIAGGRIVFAGEDLAQCSEKRRRCLRGSELAMIFQEPMTSLNPVYPVGEQIAEVLRQHRAMRHKAAFERAVELLDAVRIPNPRARAYSYPHQLSGGQRQRVMIAIAIACEPRILIADEPTTALDVTVQAEIFDLLLEMRKDSATATILITHDLGAVVQMSDHVIVMYAGRKVEEGAVSAVVGQPRHPYTRGLIDCVPPLQSNLALARVPLAEIPGIVPPLEAFGEDACLFAERCRFAQDKCHRKRPTETVLQASTGTAIRHTVACWFAESERMNNR